MEYGIWGIYVCMCEWNFDYFERSANVETTLGRGRRVNGGHPSNTQPRLH